jgi:hypothetical protein
MPQARYTLPGDQNPSVRIQGEEDLLSSRFEISFVFGNQNNTGVFPEYVCDSSIPNYDQVTQDFYQGV